MPGQSYRDLIVWQKSIDLAELVYTRTKSFPADERFGLVSQMRRAAVSVPSNIAEGQFRTTSREFSRFLDIARGSNAELETHTIIAARLKFLDETSAAEMLARFGEVGRMLSGLIRSLPAEH